CAFVLPLLSSLIFFFFQAEDGIRDATVTGVQTCALPISRLGHFNRLRQHRRATDDELDRFFHGPRPAAVTILVPSYKEDPLVVRRTLLSAALQDYPWRRVVLLIDDPPHPSQASDIPLLTAARGLAAEIHETLRKPREHFEDALRAFLERSARGPLDPHQEMPR